MISFKQGVAAGFAALALGAMGMAPAAFADTTSSTPTNSAPTATAQVQAGDVQAMGCTVGSPRVRYWCNTVRPATAYTNYSTASKHYNEMYEGGSLPIGIYMESGGSKFHVVNGTGYVYKTIPSTTAWALCWNRSSSATSSATCDYVRD
ncbi:hypothetical protein [Nocardia sp. NRRL S-836]|uniref:hypothetical protein n=1 Tax=Nocardia sp. NRRL S-836 TaxID=1519492 RepID=UPI0006B00F50|nr:hypothetical protein [Nocardia sp. NRRL S-836]KOV85384.1 hypothetical protein ADL03_14830 [Nocardia sp. NRRL S-836]